MDDNCIIHQKQRMARICPDCLDELKSQARQLIDALTKITMLRPCDALGAPFERAQIIAHDALAATGLEIQETGMEVNRRPNDGQDRLFRVR